MIIQVGMYSGWACMSHAVRQYTEVIEADGLSIDYGDGEKPKSPAMRRRDPTRKQTPRKRARRLAKKGKR